MDASVCLRCLQLQRRLAELETDNRRLRQSLDEAQRAGKRQAAPFSRGEPTAQPKRPGRKAGDRYGKKAHRQPPAPKDIDETLEAPLPDACPHCSGPIHECEIVQQYQVEIPRKPIHRQFNVHVGHCQRCQRRVQGRHPLQTSDALGAAAAQLGPDAQAGIVELNKQAGMSHAKVARCLGSFFGIPLTRGGVTHVILRAARRCEPVYAALREQMPDAPWQGLDETGWRVGGLPAWLHTAVTAAATIYIIDPTRSGDVAEDLLGIDYAGILLHDGWSPYDRFQHARHQQCNQHILRRCQETLETASRGAVRFPRRIAELLRQGLDLSDRHAAGQVSDHGLAVAAGRLQHVLEDVVFPTKTNPTNETLAQHLWNHIDEFFTFLHVPGLDATNWRAEQAIRFGVILRKLWGGNRTWVGAQAQAILMSIWRTCWQQGLSALDFLSQLLRGQAVALALPP
jgi:transposase